MQVIQLEATTTIFQMTTGPVDLKITFVSPIEVGGYYHEILVC